MTVLDVIFPHKRLIRLSQYFSSTKVDTNSFDMKNVGQLATLVFQFGVHWNIDRRKRDMAKSGKKLAWHYLDYIFLKQRLVIFHNTFLLKSKYYSFHKKLVSQSIISAGFSARRL